MTKEELCSAMDLYQDMVYRIALNYMGNAADAQDISQEAFLRLYRCKTIFPTEEQRRAWLIRVTINLGKNILRSPWHRIMQQNPADAAEQAAQNADSMEIHVVTEQIQKLSKQDRVVLHLYYFEEYGTKEIAGLLNMQEAAVRKRLSRARKRLEKLIKEESLHYEGIEMDPSLPE